MEEKRKFSFLQRVPTVTGSHLLRYSKNR